MQRDIVAQKASTTVNDRYTRSTGGLSFEIHAGYVRFMRRRPKITSGRIDSNQVEDWDGLQNWVYKLRAEGKL